LTWWRRKTHLLGVRVAIPRETATGETRVALVPESVERLRALGHAVGVETGAGSAAGFPDAAYRAAGAEIETAREALYGSAGAVLKVRAPRALDGGRHEADFLSPGAVLVGLLEPGRSADLLERLRARRASAFALESLPRLSRAQKMDVLSSMSTIAGYKAALLAASQLGRLFPLLMTAAGTLAPARVLVIGAGVAGLQAIATARRLGAVVEATDVRPAVREEVQSLGASFVELGVAEEEAVGAGGYARPLSESQEEAERRVLAERARQADVVIATAMVPDRPAPRLLGREAVEAMRPGSVIVDLAAEQGGNCELTRPGETVEHAGIRILGPRNLAATVPGHASLMFSRNLYAFFQLLFAVPAGSTDGRPRLALEDEIVRATCLLHEGRDPAEAPAVAR
jgi:NAD(P) transhydrogenase subunit alpha